MSDERTLGLISELSKWGQEAEEMLYRVSTTEKFILQGVILVAKTLLSSIARGTPNSEHDEQAGGE